LSEKLACKVCSTLPDCRTRTGIEQARQLLSHESAEQVANSLATARLVTCPDTVPFALWSAAKYLGDFRAAIANTAAAGGDCDTNCAIVGGIVALSVGWDGIPPNWLEAREHLPFHR